METITIILIMMAWNNSKNQLLCRWPCLTKTTRSLMHMQTFQPMRAQFAFWKLLYHWRKELYQHHVASVRWSPGQFNIWILWQSFTVTVIPWKNYFIGALACFGGFWTEVTGWNSIAGFTISHKPFKLLASGSWDSHFKSIIFKVIIHKCNFSTHCELHSNE